MICTLLVAATPRNKAWPSPAVKAIGFVPPRLFLKLGSAELDALTSKPDSPGQFLINSSGWVGPQGTFTQTSTWRPAVRDNREKSLAKSRCLWRLPSFHLTVTFTS